MRKELPEISVEGLVGSADNLNVGTRNPSKF